MSTLAAGYAETGQWDEAIKWSKKAVETGEGSVKEQLEKELASYQEKKPWRERQDIEAEKEEGDADAGDKAAKETEPVVKKNDEK